MLPKGFFGARSDAFMDVAIVALTVLPVLMLIAFRAARRGHTRAHRNMQAATLALVLLIVVLFELDVRLSGGKAAFLARNADRARVIEPVLRAHIAVASATFFAWLSLGVASWSRFGQTLPGPFSRWHRRLGLMTFAGACLLSLSGALIYALAFVF
jgi:putative membrane protein